MFTYVGGVDGVMNLPAAGLPASAAALKRAPHVMLFARDFIRVATRAASSVLHACVRVPEFQTIVDAFGGGVAFSRQRLR